ERRLLPRDRLAHLLEHVRPAARVAPRREGRGGVPRGRRGERRDHERSRVGLLPAQVRVDPERDPHGGAGAEQDDEGGGRAPHRAFTPAGFAISASFRPFFWTTSVSSTSYPSRAACDSVTIAYRALAAERKRPVRSSVTASVSETVSRIPRTPTRAGERYH